jgi:hypothetical protein
MLAAFGFPVNSRFGRNNSRLRSQEFLVSYTEILSKALIRHRKLVVSRKNSRLFPDCTGNQPETEIGCFVALRGEARSARRQARSDRQRATLFLLLNRKPGRIAGALETGGAAIISSPVGEAGVNAGGALLLE